MDLNFFSILVMAAVLIFLFWIFNSIYVIKEWERGVVLRLGRMLPDARERDCNSSSIPSTSSRGFRCGSRRSTYRRRT